MPAPDFYGLPTTILSRVCVVDIDAVLSEKHRFDNLVTEHPLEDGSPVTDHIVNQPVVLDMEGRITDTPLSILASVGSGATGLIASDLSVDGQQIDPAAIAAGTGVLGATLPGRAKLAYQELVALYVSRETFTVLSGINEYLNMAFESLEFPRNAQDGRSLRFRATMRELIIVGVTRQSNAELVVEEFQNTGVETNNRGTVPNIAL